MAWGRIDDGHWRHRKVADLDDDMRKPCLATYWLAISWCNDHRTDGRVTQAGLRQIDGTTAEADELVRVNLWERDGKAYRVHDFLDFNKSREQLEQESVQRTMAGHAGAAARWPSHGKSHGTSLSKSHGTVPSEMDGGSDAPYPVSRIPVSPEPTLAREGLPNIDDEAREFLEGLTGRPILTAGPKQLAEYDRQLSDHGKAAVTEAYSAIAKTMKSPTARQLVWSALRVLEPFAKPEDIRRVEAAEREAEARRSSGRAVEATRRYLAELRGDPDQKGAA